MASPGAFRRSSGPHRLARFMVEVVWLASGTSMLACGSSKPAPGAAGGAGVVGTGAGGAGGAAGAGGVGGAGEVAALAEFATAYCSAARTCCAAAPGADGILASCEKNLPGYSGLFGAVSAGTVVPDQTVLPGCIAALQQQTPVDCAAPPACLNLWKGTKVEGQPCVMAFECIQDAGPVLCFRDSESSTPGSTIGVCRAAARGVAGSPCLAACGPGLSCGENVYQPSNFPIAFCYTQDGLYCEAGFCKALVEIGAPCDVDPDCGTEAYCDTTCTPRKTAGQSCVQDHECSLADHLACVDDICSTPAFANNLVCNGDLVQ